MNRSFLIGLLSALIISSSGCLKDEKYMEIDKTAPIVEFPIGGPGVVENSYDVTDISKNLDTSVAINIASPQTLDHDVRVTVRVTPTIVTEYNTAHGTSFTPLPASAYGIDDYTIVIPKGYRVGRFKIKLLFPKFDLTQSFALGLQIVDAPGLTISGNFNKFLWSFNLRNKYDGVYRARGIGFLGGNTSAPYTFNIACGSGDEIAVSTSGANSVRFDYQPLLIGGAVSGFSNILPELTFNPANDLVTNVTGYGASTAFVFPTPLSPGYVSRFDPATRTIYVSYGFALSATWYVRDTLTYCGPR